MNIPHAILVVGMQSSGKTELTKVIKKEFPESKTVPQEKKHPEAQLIDIIRTGKGLQILDNCYYQNMVEAAFDRGIQVEDLKLFTFLAYLKILNPLVILCTPKKEQLQKILKWNTNKINTYYDAYKFCFDTKNNYVVEYDWTNQKEILQKINAHIRI